MRHGPFDDKEITNAKQLAERQKQALEEAREKTRISEEQATKVHKELLDAKSLEERKKARQAARRKQANKVTIEDIEDWDVFSSEALRKKFPGAWLTARRQYPGGSPNLLVAAAREILMWHQSNGTLETCADRYRGDFYVAEPNSPESKLYWGDFWEHEPIADEPSEPVVVVFRGDRGTAVKRVYEWSQLRPHEQKRLSQTFIRYSQSYDPNVSIDVILEGFKARRKARTGNPYSWDELYYLDTVFGLPDRKRREEEEQFWDETIAEVMDEAFDTIAKEEAEKAELEETLKSFGRVKKRIPAIRAAIEGADTEEEEAEEPVKKPQSKARSSYNKYNISGHIIDRKVINILNAWRKQNKATENDKRFFWEVCENYELAYHADLDGVYHLVREGEPTVIINPVDYDKDDVMQKYDPLVKYLHAYEGDEVMLCFQNSLDKNPILVDVMPFHEVHRLEQQILQTIQERKGIEASYNDLLEDQERRIKDMIEVQSTLKVKHENELKALQHKFETEKQDLIRSIEKTKRDRLELRVKKADEIKIQRQRYGRTIAKLETFVNAYDEAQNAIVEQTVSGAVANVNTYPPDNTMGFTQDWSKTKSAKRTKMQEKRREPDEENDNKIELPNSQEAIQAARIRELEAENASERATVIAIQGFAALQSHNNRTEEENDALMRQLDDQNMEELSEEERKHFDTNNEKLQQTLSTQFGKRFEIRLKKGHPQKQLALRGGIIHQADKITIELNEHIKNNVYRVLLPNYSISIFVALDFDKNHKDQLVACTWTHLAGTKWRRIERQHVKVTDKWDKSVTLEQCINHNKVIAAQVFVGG